MKHRIGSDLDGSRLDKAVAELGGMSRSEAKSVVEAGGVLVGGSPGLARHRLSEGDVIEFDLPEPEPLLAPEEVEFDVVYADSALVVVDKPSGLVVHPGSGHRRGTLASGLLQRFPEIEGVGDPGRWGIVHRLDKGTSGLMVVARTKESHRALSRAIRRREVKRTYSTLVFGAPSAPRGTIDAPLGADPVRPSRRKVIAGGKHAITHYSVVERFDRVALLDVDLETGRTHQIRVHLASIDLPVVGDKVYGRPGPVTAPRIFLHARKIAFEHPLDGNEVTFESPLPADLAAVLAQLKKV